MLQIWRAAPIAPLLVFAAGLSGVGQDSRPALEKPLPSGSTVYIAPVKGGFDTYLAAALQRKHVPLIVVDARDKAQFEISSVSESEKASWAKTLILRSTASKEEAAIKVMNVLTGDVVFAYAVHKGDSFHGKQSAAEACAKHIKEKIEKVER